MPRYSAPKVLTITYSCSFTNRVRQVGLPPFMYRAQVAATTSLGTRNSTEPLVALVAVDVVCVNRRRPGPAGTGPEA